MSAPATARLVALDVLIRVEQGAYSHVLLPEALRATSLDGRDRAFATELVYGTLRAQRRLDHLVAAVSHRSLPRLDPPVRAALRLGAYQLVAGVPAHAAVSATVEALGARSPRARGFVNGVLRSLDRAGPPWPEPAGDSVEATGVRTSHPDWIVSLLVEQFGPEDAAATLAVDNEAPAVTLRPARGRADDVAARLRADGVAVERGGLVRDALVVRGIGDPAVSPVVRDGLATPQDQGSQAVLDVVAPTPGERILDVAAAPGGKATGLAERVGPTGCVVAADLAGGRLGLVSQAAARLGLRGVVLPVVADGRRPPWPWSTFDAVLLDAPCSGLGVLRRRPEARWRVGPEAPAALARLQRELLAAAAPLVRPGGRLVYAVCTLTPEETIGVDEWARAALPALEAEARPGAPWRPHGRGALVLPGDAGTDGMFVLGLRRAR